MRSTAPKRKHQAFSLAEKIWLLNFSTANPKLNANQLGQAIAAHLKKDLPANRFPRNAPGASPDNKCPSGARRSGITRVQQEWMDPLLPQAAAQTWNDSIYVYFCYYVTFAFVFIVVFIFALI
jgi:hypothetical protein